jgi:predicted nucleic acid-binding protein
LTAFILDNSVTMRWCFENATHPYADSVPETLTGGEAVVPVLWRYEVSAVLAKAQKDGIISATKVGEFLALLQSFNVRVDVESAEYILTDVHRIAVTWRLTSYDAAYLALAMRRQLPLATLDTELIRACKAAGQALL